jgi:ABC-2 type transport system ATP-binding protein
VARTDASEGSAPGAGGTGTRQAVRIVDLHVVRGGRTVLPGLSVRIAAGTVTGLLGPSGSGKTTLLRAIVGVQLVEGGTIEVLGEPAGSAGLRRRVAYATQAASVYDDLTVRENLRYFAAVLGAPGSDGERVVAEVGLESHADSVVGRLSGGERSRASLAVALLGSPELLVLDEPTVGLDPVLRAELWGLFHRLAGRGVTLLVSSHVMDEATRCDELLLMRDGMIIAQESPAALLERTGAPDAEQAFLRLVRGSETGAAAP